MCKSKAEGGKRCATHLRPAYLKAIDGYLHSDIPNEILLKDVVAFATTKTGANEINAKIHDGYTGTALANWLREGLTKGIALSVEEKRESAKALRAVRSQQKASEVDTIFAKVQNGKGISEKEMSLLIAYGKTEGGLEQLILLSDKINKKGFSLGSELSNMVHKGKSAEAEKQRISDTCKIECDRQHVGEIEHKQLIEAYQYMRNIDHRTLTVQTILDLGELVEPVKAKSFRRTPVTFANGGMGLTPELIPNAIEALVNNMKQLTVDEFVKEFLIIHPFQDGNGRTAFLLVNLLQHRGSYPITLPDYFGEEHLNSEDLTF